MHFHRHGRFYIALLIGAAAFLATSGHRVEFRVLLAGDAFFVGYLALMGAYAARTTPERLRQRGADGDEGLPFIFALAVLVLAFSLGAIFAILNRPGENDLAPALLAVASVPLGWAMLHTMAAFHYATMFYGRTRGAEGFAEHGGLAFPTTKTPGVTEFLYFAFVLGMAAQVSDVVVESTRMRRAVLIHSTASFFYNTVLLALAVNAALSFAGDAVSAP